MRQNQHEQAPKWLAVEWFKAHGLAKKVLAGVSLSSSPFACEGQTMAHKEGLGREVVEAHRQALWQAVGTNAQALWLHQVHGKAVVEAEEYVAGVAADACIARKVGVMPVVLTADCLPVLLVDKNASVVAAVHAGWAGLWQGIITETVKRMAQAPQSLCAWIGPAISAVNYEVDVPFYARFIEKNREYARFFRPNREGHFLADLPAMAAYELQLAGLPLVQIQNSGWCSYADKRFFSHRRDGAQAGRMVSFITLLE